MTKTTNRGGRRRSGFNPNVLPDTFSSKRFLAHLKKALQLCEPTIKTQVCLDMYLSKYVDEQVVSADQRERAAILKWQSVERLNARTNARLYLSQIDTDFGWVTSDRILSYMRSLIKRTLGKAPSPDELRLSVTSGATTRVYKGPKARYQKVSGSMHCSSSALPLWLTFASGTLFGNRLQQTDVTVVDSSVLLTVPKKTEINRVIATEPECNALLQRGIGLVIRKRLLRVGQDLRDQTRNQDLAYVGSQRGSLATIDFSSASDTLTTQLVTLLIPHDWWYLLSATRVSGTIVDGTHHDFELWSSMGNGYTFELETLIFWALASAVCYFSGVKGKISVYGDDVILPTKAAKRYIRIANWFGFKPNREKSFVDGYYRESCGKHFSHGYDVTPFFIRGELRDYGDLIGVLNQILEWNCRGYGFFVDEPIFQFWKYWSSHVPSFLKGGTDPMDPGVLVDGSLPRKGQRLVSVTRDVWYVSADGNGFDDHPAGYLLAVATGGCYSTATEDKGRLKLGAHRPFGTVGYTPGLIFESE